MCARATNLYSENSIGEDTLANVACASCGCIQCVRIHIREYQQTSQLVHISINTGSNRCLFHTHSRTTEFYARSQLCHDILYSFVISSAYPNQ